MYMITMYSASADLQQTVNRTLLFYEILRQGKTGFVGWSGPAGGDWDSLIGEGRVRAYINCYTANSGYTNVARRFRAAIEKGELTYEDYSQDVLMLQLHAASLGLPYLPVRMMQGSGLVKFWGISEEKRKTMEGVDNLKCVDIENPFEPGEKLLAVPVPKLDCAIIHVQQASPDGTCIIEVMSSTMLISQSLQSVRSLPARRS